MMPEKPKRRTGGLLPSTRARSKALYEAYSGLRETLEKEEFAKAVSQLEEAHRQARVAVKREYGFRTKKFLQWREKSDLPVVLRQQAQIKTATVGQLFGEKINTGTLDSFKREIQTHLFVAAPAHAAVKSVLNVINQAPKMVLDPDETARTLKAETERKYGADVKTAAEKFLRTGNIEELEGILNDLATIDNFSQPRTIGHSITKHSILRVVANLKRAMQTAHGELKTLKQLKAPSQSTATMGKFLGIDVKKIHGVASDNIRWKNILPHRITLLSELERRYASRNRTSN